MVLVWESVYQISRKRFVLRNSQSLAKPVAHTDISRSLNSSSLACASLIVAVLPPSPPPMARRANAQHTLRMTNKGAVQPSSIFPTTVRVP